MGVRCSMGLVWEGHGTCCEGLEAPAAWITGPLLNTEGRLSKANVELVPLAEAEAMVSAVEILSWIWPAVAELWDLDSSPSQVMCHSGTSCSLIGSIQSPLSEIKAAF